MTIRNAWGVLGALLCLVGGVGLVGLGGCGQGKPAPDAAGGAPAPAGSVQAGAIQVRGAHGQLTFPDGRKAGLGATSQDVPVRTRLELDQRKSKCLTAYPAGGEIEFIGRVNAELRENGFYTDRGTFVAAFAGNRKTFYQVVTPTAVFGIKGTKIAFRLENGIGRVTLLEGRVTVAPAGKPQEEREMTPGQTVHVGSETPRIETPTNPGGVPGKIATATLGQDFPGLEIHQSDDLGTAAQRLDEVE